VIYQVLKEMRKCYFLPGYVPANPVDIPGSKFAKTPGLGASAYEISKLYILIPAAITKYLP